MSQEFTRVKTVFSALAFVFIFATFSFGQGANLENDLDNSFKKFNLVQFSNKTALRKAAIENKLSIPAAGRNFELLLTPRDLRSAGYQAENTVGNTVNRLEAGAVTTFSGTISGEPDSQVRISMDAGKIEGYFISGGEMYAVEPALKFSRAASAEQYVVYLAKDLINQESTFCERSIAEKISQGKEMLAAEGVQSPQGLSVIELATEADFEFVGALGGANQANKEILDILNMVEGVYARELNLTISVTYQHTWTTQDPFAATDTLALLTSFKDYWNTNFPVTQKPRDATHLFSGKPTVAGQGLAYIGVVCKTPAAAYSMTGRINFAPVKFQLTAHEIGHNFGGRHVDITQASENTLMNAVMTPTTQFTFSAYSRTELTNFVSANNGCLSPQVIAKNKFDYDGDGKTDIALFRPSDTVWYVSNSAGGTAYTQFGLATDKIVPADYDGDGKTDIAVYRPENGVWFILKSSSGTAQQYSIVQFGASEDVPMPADYNGDGKAEIAVFRPSTGVWFIYNGENTPYSAVQFGLPEDKPVAADYNGDGRADIAVFRPSSGLWFVYNDTTKQYSSFRFGLGTDKPVPADYNGDGKTDIAVYRPSEGNWYILQGTDGYTVSRFGLATDLPAAADYDGDGKADIAVYRPAEGNWYILQSRDGFNIVRFGTNGDKPIPNMFVR